MSGVKMVVLYPRPTDVKVFEKRYKEEHIPLATKKLTGKTKIVATKITNSPQGVPPFHRIAEVHFPSMEALQACASSDGGKETVAHAQAISTGGPLTILIAEEETLTFPAVPLPACSQKQSVHGPIQNSSAPASTRSSGSSTTPTPAIAIGERPGPVALTDHSQTSRTSLF